VTRHPWYKRFWWRLTAYDAMVSGPYPNYLAVSVMALEERVARLEDRLNALACRDAQKLSLYNNPFIHGQNAKGQKGPFEGF
jgi:hypothetical protein